MQITKDNIDTLKAAYAAGDDVEYSVTGETVWRVEKGHGISPLAISSSLGIDITPTITGDCEWFALCFQPAVGHVKHPVLGSVPTCQKCVDRFELPITY